MTMIIKKCCIQQFYLVEENAKDLIQGEDLYNVDSGLRKVNVPSMLTILDYLRIQFYIIWRYHDDHNSNQNSINTCTNYDIN